METKTDLIDLNNTGRRAGLRFAALAVCALALALPALAQRHAVGAGGLVQRLDRLRVVGRVLHVAAHPDDERTNVLAWSARGKHLRTAYLSLTRGEGGQNLIGDELFEELGVIRTQELLAARRIDGAEQFFTRAIDFGFSKTPQETMEKWGREAVLGDMVWIIRRFRPDVIFNGFTGTPRDGHGHHQTSAILSKEAFRAAADPTRFPEQLKYVKPWQAKRLFWATSPFGRFNELEDTKAARVNIDPGEFNAALGYSYAEIAGQSRSNHRSQGFGAGEPKGSSPAALIVLDGETATKDMMEGVDTTWARIPGGAPVQPLLDKARLEFRPENPAAILPHLLAARKLIASLDHLDAKDKLVELDETIAQAAGLWLEVTAEKAAATPGEKVQLTLTAVNRGSGLTAELANVELIGIPGAPGRTAPLPLPANERKTENWSLTIPANQERSSLLWLARPRQGNLYQLPRQEDTGRPEGDPQLRARFTASINGTAITIERPVVQRYVDQTRGELTRPFVVAPPVAVSFARRAFLFPDAAARRVEVEVRAVRANTSGTVRLAAPQGWSITPAQHAFALKTASETVVVSFDVTPPAGAKRDTVRAVAAVDGAEVATGMKVIAHDHIPPQTLFPAAEATLTRADVKVTSRNVGYVMGPGDSVPDALRQMGCTVTLLDAADLSRGDLAKYDAIVLGVRTWNNRFDLRTNYARLLQYASAGGTLVMQYNDTASFIFGRGDNRPEQNMGPLPFRVGRERVTVEEAPVKFLAPDHALLQMPNRITAADFDGWVQERGLYFANQFDPGYTALLEMNDPGEPPQKGGLLYTRTGKGAYVFAPLAFFRQFPAGVPGAYRLFANLIGAGKLPN